MFKKYTLITCLRLVATVNYIPCSKSIFSLLVFSTFCLMLTLKIGFFINTIPLVPIFLDFDHSYIKTVKINESINNEYTYLSFDIPKSNPGPESNSRL